MAGIPLFLWFTVFTLLFRQAMSLYHVPHLALGAELTKDYHERSIVMSYNSIFAVVGGAGAACVFGWTWSSEGPWAAPARGPAYGSLGPAIALLAALIIFASAYFTRDQIPRLPQPPADQPRATLRVFFARFVLASAKPQLRDAAARNAVSERHDRHARDAPLVPRTVLLGAA